MVNININLSNRAIYSIIAFGIIMILGIGVYAYNLAYNDPSVMGHSAGELDLSGGVNGDALFNGGIIISDTSSVAPGTIKFDGSNFLAHNGAGWESLTNPITVSLAVFDPVIPVGYSTTLSWAVAGATSCQASGAWSGAKSASGGSEVVSPSATGNFILTCTNSVGSSLDSIVINVKQWQDVSGQGNPGESCNQWLARTGQAGILNSPNRLKSQPPLAMLEENQCFYFWANKVWARDSDFSSPSYYPVANDILDPNPFYDVVQTRR